MKTQPRMSAPIGRVQLRPSDARGRRASTTGRWRSADPPMEADVTEQDDAPEDSARPRFYPFPLRSDDPRDG
ncbi:MAG TPA: hypothetical protein VLS88_17125 [Polyangiales bacterium]|nr:hypothetical protein [Polyangiales bacterium]